MLTGFGPAHLGQWAAAQRECERALAEASGRGRVASMGDMAWPASGERVEEQGGDGDKPTGFAAARLMIQAWLEPSSSHPLSEQVLPFPEPSPNLPRTFPEPSPNLPRAVELTPSLGADARALC